MGRSVHFPLFGGLRAIAALSVFGFHAVYQVSVFRPGDRLWYPLGVNLDVGVPVFFAISGFLLYRPFLAAALAGRGPSVGAYLWRRALRIVPAYWVALAGITIWFDFEEVQSLSGVLRFGLFAQVYDPDTALRAVGQAWTLNVEVVFYLLLPLLAVGPLAARTVRRALWAVLALGGASVAWKCLALTQADANSERAYTWLLSFPAQLDHLAAGMLLAVLSVWAREAGGLPGLLARAQRLVERRPGRVWLLAGLVYLLCGAVDPGTRAAPPISDPDWLVKHELRALFAVLLLAPAVFGDDLGGWPRRVLAWRPLALVGLVSYSFYLWHYAVVAQGLRWFPAGPQGSPEWLAWIAATLAGGLLLAAVSYRLVERPFLALKRLVPVSGPRGAEAEAEAAQARAAP